MLSSVRAPAVSRPAASAGRTLVPLIEAKAAATRRARVADRHKRLRKKLNGTTERPRLAVFRSNEHIYAQVIDDSAGHTLVSASTVLADVKASLEDGNGGTVAAATVVGQKLAELCKAKGVSKVAFDRGGFAYHGRVKALADAAREGGLDF